MTHNHSEFRLSSDFP